MSRANVDIVVFAASFLPGRRSGGPIRSLDALTRIGQDALSFHIITRDRDGDGQPPYTTVPQERWVELDARRAYYFNARSVPSLIKAMRAARRVDADVYHINSVWNVSYSLVPLLLMVTRLLPRRPLVVSPRGELLIGALSSKRPRKAMVWPFVRLCYRLLKPTIHCTSTAELDAVKARLPHLRAFHAANLVRQVDAVDRVSSPAHGSDSNEGRLRVITVGRVHPHKNIAGAIEAAIQSGRAVSLTVVGAHVDARYLQRCRDVAASASTRVDVRFVGDVGHDRVLEHLRAADVFLLPTKSENFGHAIREALAVGCPVLTSEDTPWSDVLSTAGLCTRPWSDMAGFAHDLAAIDDMSAPERTALRDAVREAYTAWEADTQRAATTSMIELYRGLAGAQEAVR